MGKNDGCRKKVKTFNNGAKKKVGSAKNVVKEESLSMDTVIELFGRMLLPTIC